MPDDTTFEHYMVNGTVIHHNDVEDPKEDAQVTRELAYGSIGDQLDMQYKDSVDGGTRWKDHIANVKATTTAPSSLGTFTADEKKIQLEGRKAWDAWVDNWSPP